MLHSWYDRLLSTFSSRLQRLPRRRLPRRRRGISRANQPVSLERLENRTLLAQIVDLGPLRFSADSFTQNGNDYSADGTIQLGLAPNGSENFQPLVEILGSVQFTVGTADPAFTVTNSTLASVVQTTPAEIALWTGTATFSADDLAGSGVGLTNATAFQVDGTSFTASLLSFANPAGGTTGDAVVQLQGGLTLAEIGGLTVTVGGTDFVTINAGGPGLSDLQQSISPADTLTLFGLKLIPDQLNISYSSNQGEFGIYGTLSASTAGNEIVNADVSVGTEAEPGITIEQGLVKQIEFGLSEGIEIWELQLEGSSLTWEYDGALNRYEIYGDTQLSTSSPVYFAGALGDSGSPGVTISGATGEVEGFRMQVANPVLFGPLTFDAQDVVFQYDASLEEYQLSGTLSVPELFDATVALGTTDQPAVVYKAGAFELDDLTFSLSDVYLGAFVVDKFVLKLSYDDSTDWSFEVDAVVWFPANFAVQAEIGFQDGVLNTFGFGASGLNIEIGDTGLVIKGISGEIQNLDQPADIIVSGSLTVAWGDTMKAFPTPFGPRDISLFGARGAFTVNKDMLSLEGDFFSGMFLDPVTGSATGIIGTGQGTMTLNWGDFDYQMSLDVEGYWDTFELKGTIAINLATEEIFFLAQADVNVPDFIPFVGGDTIADVDFALKYVAGGPYSEDFVAGWTHVDLPFFSTEIGVKVNFSGDASVIEHHQTPSD
ncbi:MAG: hypothetical protein KF861_04870 [Planctomycetaceae bacterium]|nr:hypothetical protein [Planctomycetaceae bacterium]